MEKQYKVLMLCFPAPGHLNPFVCYARELAKTKNVKVIMYSDEQNRQVIEAGNIEFRPANFKLQSQQISVKEARTQMPIHKILGLFMEATDMLLPELVRCVQEEDIDLIIYDFMTVYAKWLLKHLKVKHQKGELKKPPPKALMFGPSLLHQKGVYPNSYEERLLPKPKLTIGFVWNMIVFFVKYVFFCFKYDLPVEHPVNLIFYTKETLNICCVMPEFQPRSHMFPSNIKFVGNCASEEVRGAKEIQEPLKSFLAPFPEINPLPMVGMKADDSRQAGQPKLIYASFGTLVNTDIVPFLKLIDGVKSINRSSPNEKFKFLISTGDKSYNTFQEMIKAKQVDIPDNLLLLPSVPQLDVLKRASLFITHSGQGGTSEAIHYGVPMVCIPVMGDQPAVAYRTADELGLGIQLNFDTFDGEAIKEASLAVLSDKTYLDRVLLFSQCSRKYQGTKDATKITIEYLQTKSKSD